MLLSLVEQAAAKPQAQVLRPLNAAKAVQVIMWKSLLILECLDVIR